MRPQQQQVMYSSGSGLQVGDIAEIDYAFDGRSDTGVGGWFLFLGVYYDRQESWEACAFMPLDEAILGEAWRRFDRPWLILQRSRVLRVCARISEAEG